VAQPVEVDVGARGDGDQPAITPAPGRHIALEPGDRKCAGRLEDGAAIFKDFLHRGTDLVVRDQYDLVDPFSA
jgi:hypothetical protein